MSEELFILPNAMRRPIASWQQGKAWIQAAARLGIDWHLDDTPEHFTKGSTVFARRRQHELYNLDWTGSGFEEMHAYHIHVCRWTQDRTAFPMWTVHDVVYHPLDDSRQVTVIACDGPYCVVQQPWAGFGVLGFREDAEGEDYAAGPYPDVESALSTMHTFALTRPRKMKPYDL